MNKVDVEFRSIKEMCDIYKVTPRTLRFYEFKELLFPIRAVSYTHLTLPTTVRV